MFGSVLLRNHRLKRVGAEPISNDVLFRLFLSSKLSFNKAKSRLERRFYIEFSRIEQARIVGHFERCCHAA